MKRNQKNVGLCMLEIYVSMKYVCVNKVVAYITFNSAFLIHGTLKFYLPEDIFFLLLRPINLLTYPKLLVEMLLRTYSSRSFLHNVVTCFYA